MSAVPVSAETPKANVSVRMLDVKSIRPSRTNPRSSIDAAHLAELAASIKEKGVLEPILVRTDGGGFEIIAGERRWRAAREAGEKTVPAIVRDDLGPKEALEVQVIENLQRADLSPLEEAEALDRLQKECGYSIRDLMARVSKSESYVHSRLVLLRLPAAAKKALTAREITDGVALLIARLPQGRMREEAARMILRASHPDGSMDYREAAAYIQEHYMLALKGAPFSLDDGELVPSAGACTTCPKRTGNAPSLFGDVKKEDLCTDGACFAAKREAAWKETVRRSKEKGLAVLNDAEAGKIIGGGYVRFDCDFVDLDVPCPNDPKGRTWQRLLGSSAPDVKLARDPHNFRVHRLVTKHAAKEALKKVAPELVQRQKPSLSAPEQKARAKEREKTKRDRIVAAAARAEIVRRAESKVPAEGWRFLCSLLIDDAWMETVKEVAESRCPIGTPEPRSALRAALWKMTEGEVRAMTFDVLLAQRSRIRGAGLHEDLRDACRAFGIDIRKLASKALKEVTAESKKK